MKRSISLLSFLVFTLSIQAQTLKNFQDSLSYAVGVLMGQNIKQQGITDVNPQLMAQAIGDMLSANKGPLDPAASNSILRKFMESKKEAEKKKNIEEGLSFLKENGKRPNVVSLENGLQYEIIQAGEGPKPKLENKVKVHYTGRLTNGDVFDSSVERGEPAVFGLGQVIKGWTEILQLMPVGSKWIVYIPQELAYGDRGAGGQIGPYSTLIFDIELISIEE
jgi:FKBP-type peptidyl-prolyl cis-trans isomerase FklB